MLCGGPSVLADLKQLLIDRGYEDGSIASAGDFVLEKAFVETRAWRSTHSQQGTARMFHMADDRFAQSDAETVVSVRGDGLTTVSGVVRPGRQLGRTLGYPTANVALGQDSGVSHGVYATETTLPDGRTLPGVANVGTNPTVEEVEPRLEVWLFDFDEDLYHQTIHTTLIAHLRPEFRFPDLPALVAQIAKDAVDARRALAARRGSEPDPG